MKVGIIGASLSGMFTAYLLAQKGIAVEVYEKSPELMTEPRTLIVTGKLVDALGFFPREAILTQVRFMEIFSRSRSTRLEMHPAELVLERGRLLRLLVRMAETEGVNINFGHRFQDFQSAGDGVSFTLETEGGRRRREWADVLVGADGAMSAVSRAAAKPGPRLAALLQARVNFARPMPVDACQVWFDTERTRYFFWVIPESGRQAVVGLIAEDEKQAEKALEQFLRERNLSPLEVESSLVPLHPFRGRGAPYSSGRSVFTVGDAAAQVKVTTVGGVVSGFWGARALSDALLNGRHYARELRRPNLELDLHFLLRYVLHHFRDQDYDYLIDLLDGRLKTVLRKYTRDELTRSLFRLLLRKPSIVTLGAKVLLRALLGISPARAATGPWAAYKIFHRPTIQS